jgi:hypothetical protein
MVASDSVGSTGARARTRNNRWLGFQPQCRLEKPDADADGDQRSRSRFRRTGSAKYADLGAQDGVRRSRVLVTQRDVGAQCLLLSGVLGGSSKARSTVKTGMQKIGYDTDKKNVD